MGVSRLTDLIRVVSLLALASGCAWETRTPDLSPLATSGEVSGVQRRPMELQILSPAECRHVVQDDATPDSLLQAAQRNLEYLSRLPSERRVRVADRVVSVEDLVALTRRVAEFASNLPELCNHAGLARVQTAEDLWVSGYYQPELRASRKKTERFRYPIYRTPDDLVDVDLRELCPECPPRVLQGRVRDGRLVPYYTRGEIERGALAGRGFELAWVEDPVEHYFLHVQGSALLEFEDGVKLQLSYASTNGHPYVSLGKVLTEQGKLSRTAVSLREIKDYLRAHPEEQAYLLALNPRYLFFRGVVAGPVGSCEVPLTAGRSVAADPDVYPHGTIGFLFIQADSMAASRGYRRMVFLQDRGTTVSGPARLDVYWGTGEVAQAVAESLRQRGVLYLFLPRQN